MADISIPEGDNPVRYQASLGGNQKYRNMGNISGQAYLVRGQVTNVYYQKGTLDFNTYGSSITSGTTDGSGSAPIPVDFWGKNTDGKVFGCYRPVQKGSQILVAYIGGDTSRPIVVGVYPDNESSYELISPVHYNTGDDSTDDVQNDALGERKIYPNQQMMYESGKGDILRSMGGKSFLYISENGSGYLDDINYAYDEISDFYDADANEIEPTMTKAQSWLLVHEDNDSDEAADGHRTRFYVNRSGELMVTFANKEDPNEIVVLEASKDSGFKLTKRFDNSNLKEDSEDYVQFGIGNGNNVSIKSVDSGDATSFYLDNGNIKFETPKKGSITFDGTSVNDLLGKISDVESAANDASDKADVATKAGEIAKSAASDAASQALAASYAGEDAKSAAINAQAAGEDAKAQAKDTRDRIIYYSSISDEKDVAIPGKYIIVNTDTYIRDGTIKTAHIGDGAITNAKIADLAVGNAQLEDAAITRAKIGNLAVGTAQIEDLAITDAKVGDLSANHLKAGTIDFSVISGIHINASEIDVGKIVADQIYVNGLGDISKNLGTVTSGKITGTNINDDVDNVQSGVNDLNDPNIMNVIEKQAVSSQYAGLTSQYNVILDRAKDDGINTDDLTTAYTNLNNFITPLLKDTTKSSNIDRYTYNSLTYYYNTALSNVQAALKDAYNTDISNMQSSVAVASQAASSAAIVASQAATTGDNASYVAAQASAAASQAKIAGDNATSVANTASQAASDAVIAGSAAAVKGDKALAAASQAQIAGDNATSVANNASQAASNAVIVGSTAAVNANKAISAASQAQIAGDNATSVANTASQAASGAVLAGSTAAVNANKALSAASQAQIAGDNATSVANNATSIANTARSAADSTYAYANSEIAVQSTATAKAQSTADNAFSQAQAVGSQASAEINSNSTATAKAQSTADNAFSQATTAIDTGNVASQAVTALKDGSTMTIAQLQNGLATKVANSEYASYKDQTASQIAQMVTNGAFSAYQQTTANLISSKVANSDFSAYQATTAKAIESKVESKDFNTYKTQTDSAISSKVESSNFQALQTQVNNSSVGTNLLLNTSDYYSNWTWDVAPNIDTSQKPAVIHYPSTTLTSGTSTIANQIIGTILQPSTTYTVSFYAKGSGSFRFFCYPGVVATASSVNGIVVYSSSPDCDTTIPLTSSYVRYTITFTTLSNMGSDGKNFLLRQDYNSSDTSFNTVEAYVYGMKLEKGSAATDWSINPEDQATQSQITQLSGEIEQKVSNSDYASYKDQTASQIGEMVTNGAFSAYKQTTADLISSKVANSDFSSYKDQTATAIGSKVESKDFKSYQEQTDKAFLSKVESSDFQTLQTQVDNSAVGANLIVQSTLSSGYISPDDGSVIGSSQDLNTDYIPASGISTVTISSPDYTFTYSVDHRLAMYDADKKLLGCQNLYPTITLSQKNVAFIRISINFVDQGGTAGNMTDWLAKHRYKLEKGSVATDWCLNPEDTATQSQITQLSGDINLRVKEGDLIDQINIKAGNTLISSSGQLIMSGKSILLDSVDPVIMTSANIGNLAVGTAQIGDGAITNAKIGNLAVGTAQIGDGAITNAKIGNLAVGTAQIANGAITNAQIGSEAVGTAQIADAAINSAKISDLAVGTAQIGDGAITNAKIANLAVGTAQIANAAITDAQIGSAAVGNAQIKDAAINSAKIADLAVGTAQIGDGAITNAKIGNLAVGTAQIANAAITDAQVGNVSATKLTAGTIDFNTITGKNINASNITTGKLDTERLDVDKLSAVSADLGKVTTGSLKGVDIVANSFSTPNGSFTTDKDGNVVVSNLTIRGVTNLVYNAALLGGSGSSIPGWILNGEPSYSDAESFEGVAAIDWNGDATGRWDAFAYSKLYPVTQTGVPYSVSIKFRDYGSQSGMVYTATLAFFKTTDPGSRFSWTDYWYTANGSDSGIQTFTVNNLIAPSDAKYVALQLQAYNGKGHVAFSSPMLTQTAQSTGYQPDTGNIVNAGIINGSTISAGTINGATINASTINASSTINGSTINGATVNASTINASSTINGTTINGSTINGSTINGSTIIGGALNMQTDGLINSPYTGIVQTADQFYHPWKLNTGQLTIGQGYITSVSSGTRSINGVPTQFNSLQGTLSASYLKFTNDWNERTYMDAEMITCSSPTNSGTQVAINATGNISINTGTASAPALNIGSGYIDASSSSSYGIFGAITLGYNPHTINSDSSLFFETGHGSGNPGINIWAKGFQSLSSRLSTKRQVRLLDDEHSNSLLLGADTATFQYNQDTNADNSNEGVIIDDVNTVKQYNLPDELITRDGKAPTDLMSFIARVISQNKYQARLIEDLQIRLRKVEIKNE